MSYLASCAPPLVGNIHKLNKVIKHKILNIDKSLSYNSYLFPLFFFCSLINRRHSSWVIKLFWLQLLLRTAAAEHDADLTCMRNFSQRAPRHKDSIMADRTGGFVFTEYGLTTSHLLAVH